MPNGNQSTGEKMESAHRPKDEGEWNHQNARDHAPLDDQIFPPGSFNGPKMQWR
jgi:hypothetical protein